MKKVFGYLGAIFCGLVALGSFADQSQTLAGTLWLIAAIFLFPPVASYAAGKGWFPSGKAKIGLVSGCIIAALLSIAPAESQKTPAHHTQQATPQSQELHQEVPPPEKQFVSKSFKKFHRQFGINSKLTDLQKEQEFDQEYKGKWVQWKGKVVDVSQGFLGGIELQIQHLPSTLTYDVGLNLAEGQADQAAKLAKGQTITYVGRITRWGNLLPHSVEDGEIVGK